MNEEMGLQAGISLAQMSHDERRLWLQEHLPRMTPEALHTWLVEREKHLRRFNNPGGVYATPTRETIAAIREELAVRNWKHVPIDDATLDEVRAILDEPDEPEKDEDFDPQSGEWRKRR